MKKRKRLAFKDYHKSKSKLFETGTTLDNDIFFDTYDYDFKNFINLPIKDFKKSELEYSWKESDNQYFKTQTETNLYKNIFLSDVLYADWWRIGSKKIDKLIYLSISTPYIRGTTDELLDYEIYSLIKKHYHLTFGYKNEFYIKPKFCRIKTGPHKNLYELKKREPINDTHELLKEWLDTNKDSEIYNLYKSIVLESNEMSLNVKEPTVYISKYEINNYNLVVPFNYNLTYPEIFKLLLSNQIKFIKTGYEEDRINELLKDNKSFLLQFKPQIKETYIKRKSIKRKGRKK